MFPSICNKLLNIVFCFGNTYYNFPKPRVHGIVLVFGNAFSCQVMIHYVCNEISMQVLAFEAGRKHNIRVNTISAGIFHVRILMFQTYENFTALQTTEVDFGITQSMSF